MSVPMLDLKAQYSTIKDEVLARMMGVIERQQFIMGGEIAELEKAIAELSPPALSTEATPPLATR